MAVVNSVANKLRKSVSAQPTSTQASTPEETVKRKQTLLEILDKASVEFMDKLDKSEVSLNNTADLERIVKLTLLLSGEADNIKGTVGTTEEEVRDTKSVSIARLEEMLSMDDDNVKAVYEKLFDGLNDANDEII